jgi:hypothetical protein
MSKDDVRRNIGSTSGVSGGWDFVQLGTSIQQVLGSDTYGVKNQQTQDDQPVGPEPESPTDALPAKSGN